MYCFGDSSDEVEHGPDVVARSDGGGWFDWSTVGVSILESAVAKLINNVEYEMMLTMLQNRRTGCRNSGVGKGIVGKVHRRRPEQLGRSFWHWTSILINLLARAFPNHGSLERSVKWAVRFVKLLCLSEAVPILFSETGDSYHTFPNPHFLQLCFLQ